eukprot:scaffold3846_cov108-Amphora_coffeaeformis.AAC.6
MAVPDNNDNNKAHSRNKKKPEWSMDCTLRRNPESMPKMPPSQEKIVLLYEIIIKEQQEDPPRDPEDDVKGSADGAEERGHHIVVALPCSLYINRFSDVRLVREWQTRDSSHHDRGRIFIPGLYVNRFEDDDDGDDVVFLTIRTYSTVSLYLLLLLCKKRY